MKSNRSRGFSLIELLVVIVILGVLLSIAVPNYSDYTQRTRRSDAKAALLEIFSAQERAYFENRQYTTSMADLWSHTSGSDFVSQEGYYTLTVAFSGGDSQTFTVTATARGTQAGDVDCETMTIDETGLKGATAGTGGDASQCW